MHYASSGGGRVGWRVAARRSAAAGALARRVESIVNTGHVAATGHARPESTTKVRVHTATIWQHAAAGIQAHHPRVGNRR